MKNGFFHERSTDYDIYIEPSMQSEIGAGPSINWHVQNARTENGELISDVEYNGHVYAARWESLGAEHWWTISGKAGTRTSLAEEESRKRGRRRKDGVPQAPGAGRVRMLRAAA